MHETEDRVQALQSWLFDAFKEELDRLYPNIVHDVDLKSMASLSELDSFRDSLTYPPPESWNKLLAGVFSLQMGLREVDIAIELLESATSGATYWFLQNMIPPIASSCFERLEFVIKRMARSKLIQKVDAGHLEVVITNYRTNPEFEPLRHQMAHGPHIGLGKGGWLDVGSESRVWEIIALSGGGASGLLEETLNSSINRRAEQLPGWRQFADVVHLIVGDSCEFLLKTASQQ